MGVGAAQHAAGAAQQDSAVDHVTWLCMGMLGVYLLLVLPVLKANPRPGRGGGRKHCWYSRVPEQSLCPSPPLQKAPLQSLPSDPD